MESMIKLSKIIKETLRIDYVKYKLMNTRKRNQIQYSVDYQNVNEPESRPSERNFQM